MIYAWNRFRFCCLSLIARLDLYSQVICFAWCKVNPNVMWLCGRSDKWLVFVWQSSHKRIRFGRERVVVTSKWNRQQQINKKNTDSDSSCDVRWHNLADIHIYSSGGFVFVMENPPAPSRTAPSLLNRVRRRFVST